LRAVAGEAADDVRRVGEEQRLERPLEGDEARGESRQLDAIRRFGEAQGFERRRRTLARRDRRCSAAHVLAGVLCRIFGVLERAVFAVAAPCEQRQKRRNQTSIVHDRKLLRQ
jgi:hypothetical protein